MVVAYINKVCPECGSDKVIKERIMGTQSGDLECTKCGFNGCGSRFKLVDEKSENNG
jgi:predicted RNA-binding Zn-ribbon protein involved in translation (DUF1610 family)